jgi:hypothetical protein
MKEQIQQLIEHYRSEMQINVYEAEALIGGLEKMMQQSEIDSALVLTTQTDCYYHFITELEHILKTAE